MAPARSAQAQGARTPDGLQRDHRACHRRRPRSDPRTRHEARRRAGDPSHRRPPLRLPRLRGALEEDRQRGPLGRSRAVGGRSPGRRPGTRAHCLRALVLLGSVGHLRSRVLQRTPRAGGGAPTGHGQGLHRPGPALQQGRRHGARRGRGHRAGRCPGRGVVLRALGCREARQAQSLRAVHDLNSPAGGLAAIPLECPAHDARGAGALRAWLHHLHAYRLDDAVGAGRQCGPHPGP